MSQSKESEIDNGNHKVKVVLLVSMHLRSYDVNVKNVHWRERAVYTWATLLYFTLFHTPGSAMMANKCMLLENLESSF